MKIGLTTTIPVEIVFAAGHTPVDLNNIFVTSEKNKSFISFAEQTGYPRNICGWIKGIYGAVLLEAGLDTVIAVTQGDCSNTHALMETLEIEKINVIPFAYPYDRSFTLLKAQMHELADKLGAKWKDVLWWKKRLDEIRKIAHKIDTLTWQKKNITGFENHLTLINCSDFKGHPDEYEKELLELLRKYDDMPENEENRPLVGIIGVPPIMDDFFEIIEDYGSFVVFNEVQRQFAMPSMVEDIYEQYLDYTYPYSVFHRINDIQKEIENRELTGIIHYVQSFCFRQIEDMIFRKQIELPILTIEGGDNFKTDERQKMRIHAYIEMLQSRFPC